jgi:hypothetical protein
MKPTLNFEADYGEQRASKSADPVRRAEFLVFFFFQGWTSYIGFIYRFQQTPPDVPTFLQDDVEDTGVSAGFEVYNSYNAFSF